MTTLKDVDTNSQTVQTAPHDARHFHMCTPLTQTPNSAVRRQPSPQLYLALTYLMFLPVLWQFVLNLLLPWTSKVAYLSRGSCGRAPDSCAI